MYRLRLGSCLPLGAALLVGCSDHNTPTAPSARPLAATAALVDRPYTWSFTCQGNLDIWASWYWTENGTPITSGSSVCVGDQSLSGTGVRPANANGFTAQVGNNSQSWTFDPAGPFKAGLSGSGTGKGPCLWGCYGKEHGKLTADS